jgi:predicted RNase H-like HicB family nuclease
MKPEYRYEVIIFWSEEDHAFLADVPELPGCMSDGTTYADALSNVEVVIHQWIETARDLGREVPEAKGRLRFA